MSRTKIHQRAPRKALKGLVHIAFANGTKAKGVISNVSTTGMAVRTTQEYAASLMGTVAVVQVEALGWPPSQAYVTVVRQEFKGERLALGLGFLSIPDELYNRIKALTRAD